MLGIAIIGGEGPPPEILKKLALDADLLVAADSGLIAAEQAGLKPDWVVGDMDSLADETGGLERLASYPTDRVLRHRPDKDHTDTELALELLREQGCSEIWLAGGGGGRTDHLLAIFALFERENPLITRWLTANEEIFHMESEKTLSAEPKPGSLVSVFPIGEGPWHAESTGLKWPLNGLTWQRGTFGLSNIASAGPFKIHSLQGRFLVVLN